MSLARLNSITDSSPAFLKTGQGLFQGGAITLDSGNSDSGSSPTSLMRAGNVVVLKTGSGTYVEANDAAGDRCTAPSITTSGHSDGNGVIAVSLKGGAVISVTTSTGSGTEANHATDLNADAVFKARFVASSAGGELTITARETGADVYFHVDASTIAGVGFAEGEANAASGTDADYRVTMSPSSLVDSAGTAANNDAESALSGHFDWGQLINLTKEAKAVLVRRGSPA